MRRSVRIFSHSGGLRRLVLVHNLQASQCPSFIAPYSTVVRPAARILSHLTAPDLEISVNEAYAILEEQPQLVRDFEEGLREGGMYVRYADDVLSIIDYTEMSEHSISLRCLHFNDTIDLVQSAISMDSAGNTTLDNSLPLEYCRHVIGMSFSLLIRQIAQNNKDCRVGDVKRCAVLGAGGCVLPMTLAELFPSSIVDAVELCPSVVKAAREFFGASRLEAQGRLRVHNTCALKWLGNQRDEQYQFLFLDICGVDGSAVERRRDHELLAPPPIFLSSDVILKLISILAHEGVLAINILGTEDATQRAIGELSQTLREISPCGTLQIGYVQMGNFPFVSQITEMIPGANKRMGRLNSIVYVTKTSKEILSGIDGSFLRESLRQGTESKTINFPFHRRGERDQICIDEWLRSYVSLK